MKLISWNVNGLRACVQKGFLDIFHSLDADVFCLQETKLQEGQIELPLPGYFQYWNYAEKAGYSGTAIFTKKEPISVFYGIGIPEHDKEGRVITLEYDSFYCDLLYAELSKRAGAVALSDGMGGCFFGVSGSTKGEEICGNLRRPECRIPGDRLKEPQNQPPKRGLYR